MAKDDLPIVVLTSPRDGKGPRLLYCSQAPPDVVRALRRVTFGQSCLRTRVDESHPEDHQTISDFLSSVEMVAHSGMLLPSCTLFVYNDPLAGSPPQARADERKNMLRDNPRQGTAS